MNANPSKKEKEFFRERSQDTFGYTAEYHDISHNPNLSDREIRIALYDARQRYVKQFIDFHNEECRWYREIREEEARRAKLAKVTKPAKPANITTTTVESKESETESKGSEDESEDSNSD